MADPDCTDEDRELWRRVERAREEVIAAAKWYEEDNRQVINLTLPAQRLVDAVRRLKEAERPQPRYVVREGFTLRMINDLTEGRDISVDEAVARLNAAEEK